jgi:uridine phosphorylase
MPVPDALPLPPDRPVHIDAEAADFRGNDGRGRYLLLPGSRARAEAIATRFSNHTVKSHPRGHDLHLGTVGGPNGSIDVGAISTGMGCPSIDLICTELIALGAQVLLRVGTCGSLQPGVEVGDLVVATAAVRDEGTSDHYLPREFPALAAFPLLLVAQRISGQTTAKAHFGPVHTKDSLYARELKLGPLADKHREYERLLRQGGVLASEMECAHLFVLAQLGNKASGVESVMAGAVLAVIGDQSSPFHEDPRQELAVEASIEFAFAMLFELAQTPAPSRTPSV